MASCGYSLFIPADIVPTTSVLVQTTAEGTPTVFVATKTDMTERIEVERSEAEALAAQHQVNLFWTSAKTGDNVKEAFEHLARLAMKRVLDSSPPASGGTIKPSKEDKAGASGGCSC